MSQGKGSSLRRGADLKAYAANWERTFGHRHDPKYSKAPCRKCGAYKVTVDLEDESDGCGTYYDIQCEACGYGYKVDGPDA